MCVDCRLHECYTWASQHPEPDTFHLDRRAKYDKRFFLPFSLLFFFFLQCFIFFSWIDIVVRRLLLLLLLSSSSFVFFSFLFLFWFTSSSSGYCSQNLVWSAKRLHVMLMQRRFVSGWCYSIGCSSGANCQAKNWIPKDTKRNAKFLVSSNSCKPPLLVIYMGAIPIYIGGHIASDGTLNGTMRAIGWDDGMMGHESMRHNNTYRNRKPIHFYNIYFIKYTIKWFISAAAATTTSRSTATVHRPSYTPMTLLLRHLFSVRCLNIVWTNWIFGQKRCRRVL